MEDVYAYNDFSHDGTNHGVLKKASVTPNKEKGYFISEYNGHMFPARSFDAEDLRTAHLLRHACVLDSYYGETDIAGGFGWCMADYNTHKDFGSGDRICYHGVLDMFRNHKSAASVYASQQDKDIVLEISSSMDIGEHPACLMQDVFAATNADSIRVYKNDQFVGEFSSKDSPFSHLPHGLIRIDDFIGDLMEQNEGFSRAKAADIKKILLAANKYGLSHLPLSSKLLAAKCILLRGMKMDDAVALDNKYIGNWGGTVTTYRFDAIADGNVVKSVVRRPVTEIRLDTDVSHHTLIEGNTYDVAAVRIRLISQDGAVLPLAQEPLHLAVSGPIELIGPSCITPRGGMCGTYIRTTGSAGEAVLTVSMAGAEPLSVCFTINQTTQ